MFDTTQNNLPGVPVSGFSEADRDRAVRAGISFNGTQFVYRDFKYDRLPDAVSYAELDIQREGRPAVSTTPADWLERPLPNTADQELMGQCGIVFENWRYRYQDYRYDRLADAVGYAQSH